MPCLENKAKAWLIRAAGGATMLAMSEINFLLDHLEDEFEMFPMQSISAEQEVLPRSKRLVVSVDPVRGAFLLSTTPSKMSMT